jgi:hypothetical protein
MMAAVQRHRHEQHVIFIALTPVRLAMINPLETKREREMGRIDEE